jgi:hypothetical protein
MLPSGATEDPLTLGKFEEKKVPESSMAKLRKNDRKFIGIYHPSHQQS